MKPLYKLALFTFLVLSFLAVASITTADHREPEPPEPPPEEEEWYYTTSEYYPPDYPPDYPEGEEYGPDDFNDDADYDYDVERYQDEIPFAIIGAGGSGVGYGLWRKLRKKKT